MRLPPNTQLIPIDDISRPPTVWQDITQAILGGATFDYLIGGPALTCDVLDIQSKGKKENLYIVFLSDEAPLERVLLDKGFQKRKTAGIFDSLLAGKDYGVGLIVPQLHGLNNLRQENLRPLSIDCLAKIHNGKLSVLSPLDLHIEASPLQEENLRLMPLLQVYTKAYYALGFNISERLTRHIYKNRCAESFEHVTPEGYLSFLQHFWLEPLTHLI